MELKIISQASNQKIRISHLGNHDCAMIIWVRRRPWRSKLTLTMPLNSSRVNIWAHRDGRSLLEELLPVLCMFHFWMRNPHHKSPNNEDTRDFHDVTNHSCKFLYESLARDRNTRMNSWPRWCVSDHSRTDSRNNRNPNVAIRVSVCMIVPPTFD